MKRRRSKPQIAWRSAAARRICELAGNPSTVEEAVRIVADRLLDGIHCPPTDLEAIAARLNISGFRAEDLPFSGELRREDKGFTVVYSAALSPGRRRFTVAHEIAHAIFETSGRNCPRVGKELERMCDMIAAELVMPRKAFLNCAGANVSIGKLFELARAFDSSLSATALRCAELKGVSVFEIEHSAITWGHGFVKRGPILALGHVIRDALLRALPKDRGSSAVYLQTPAWSGEWHMEWTRLGQGQRTLFLLRPGYPSETNQLLLPQRM